MKVHPAEVLRSGYNAFLGPTRPTSVSDFHTDVNQDKEGKKMNFSKSENLAILVLFVVCRSSFRACLADFGETFF